MNCIREWMRLMMGKREYRHTFRTNEEENKELLKKAHALHINVSDYIRMRIFGTSDNGIQLPTTRVNKPNRLNPPKKITKTIPMAKSGRGTKSDYSEVMLELKQTLSEKRRKYDILW